MKHYAVAISYCLDNQLDMYKVDASSPLEAVLKVVHFEDVPTDWDEMLDRLEYMDMTAEAMEI